MASQEENLPHLQFLLLSVLCLCIFPAALCHPATGHSRDEEQVETAYIGICKSLRIHLPNFISCDTDDLIMVGLWIHAQPSCSGGDKRNSVQVLPPELSKLPSRGMNSIHAETQRKQS